MSTNIVRFNYQCPDCRVDLADFYLDKDYLTPLVMPFISDNFYSNCPSCMNTFEISRITSTRFSVVIKNSHSEPINFDEINIKNVDE